MKTTTFGSEFVSAAKQGPRLFFAPLVGAINAVRNEARRITYAAKVQAQVNATADQTAKGLRGKKRGRA